MKEAEESGAMGKREDKVKMLLKRIKKFKASNKFEWVLLFGSYARGDYTKNSDVDLIIVDGSFRKKSVFERRKGLWRDWHMNQKIKHPVDFICYTPEESGALKREPRL